MLVDSIALELAELIHLEGKRQRQVEASVHFALILEDRGVIILLLFAIHKVDCLHHSMLIGVSEPLPFVAFLDLQRV